MCLLNLSDEDVATFYKQRVAIFLNPVDRFDQFVDIKVRVNTFRQGHRAGVSDDLLDDGLVDVCVCHHGDRGVAAAVRCAVDAKTVQ